MGGGPQTTSLVFCGRHRRLVFCGASTVMVPGNVGPHSSVYNDTILNFVVYWTQSAHSCTLIFVSRYVFIDERNAGDCAAQRAPPSQYPLAGYLAVKL